MYEEEEVLEDQATTDQYQWSAGNDPEYMLTSPVSPHMTIQSPVRQREAVRVSSGFDIRHLCTAWIIIETYPSQDLYIRHLCTAWIIIETHTSVRICILDIFVLHGL